MARVYCPNAGKILALNLNMEPVCAIPGCSCGYNPIKPTEVDETG